MRIVWAFTVLAFLSCAATRVSQPVYDDLSNASEDALSPLHAKANACVASLRRERAKTKIHSVMPEKYREEWSKCFTALGHAIEPTPEAAEYVGKALWAELRLDEQYFSDLPDTLIDAVRFTSRAMTKKSGIQHKKSTKKKASAVAVYKWPVAPVVVTSGFGYRYHPVTGDYRLHSGLDLEAALSQDVLAARAGTVRFSGVHGGYGRRVEVVHADGVVTTYNHLQTILVRSGQKVKSSQLLGYAGKTGVATGVHLHFEVLKNEVAVDPSELVKLPESALFAGAQ